MIRYGEETDRALNLFVKLARCWDAVAERARVSIEADGFHASEFGVLELLYHKGPLPQGEVARKLLLTTGSITHVVDKLVAQGFVRRVSCDRDRRRLYAELTEAGQARIAALFPAHAEVLRDTMSALDPDEQRALAALLKKLGRGAAGETDPEPGG